MASILVWIDSLLAKKTDSYGCRGESWKERLKGETESEIIVAKDQALQTKYHATKILHMEK